MNDFYIRPKSTIYPPILNRLVRWVRIIVFEAIIIVNKIKNCIRHATEGCNHNDSVVRVLRHDDYCHSSDGLAGAYERGGKRGSAIGFPGSSV